MKLRFHDGRDEPVSSDRMLAFDKDGMVRRLYGNKTLDATEVVDDLGPYTLDFTNMHSWGQEIPDIDERSARMFSVWCDDDDTGRMIGIAHGFFMLFPFTFDQPAIEGFYSLTDDGLYYPIAIFRALKFIEMSDDELNHFIDAMLDAVEQNWEKIRNKTVENLEANSPLWKRYATCFKKIIQFSFLIPTIDRALIEALRRRSYKTTGIFQVMSSPSRAYDEATIEHHVQTTREIVEDFSNIEQESE